MERLKAIVTAGGTSEPIDDVRVLTNLSTGRFGHALAAELADSGVDTTELCPTSTTDRLGNREGVTYEHFDTTDSLRQLLVERPDAPNIILHAAAVSDYKPVRREGKISSDQETLTIELERTPKIITELRDVYGSEAFIAGFKLLSGVTEAELVAAAFKQLKANRLNMVIANDLQHLQDGQHPLLAVTAEGGVIAFEGHRALVAKELAEFVLRRTKVEWFVSVKVDNISMNERHHDGFNELLETVHDLNILTDESGNISVNAGAGWLLVSPRQVDKSLLKNGDAVPVVVETEERVVFYTGDHKPSIDTGVSSLLYQEYPELEGIVHFHKGWGRMNAKTSFPYPCGVVEEAEEIIRNISESESTDVAVELVHHGYLLGLKLGDREALAKQWVEAKHTYIEHLEDVGVRENVDESLLRPIFDGLSIAGVIYDQPLGASVYLHQDTRGTGLGNHIAEQLIKRGYIVQTVDDCEVRDFYKKHGFSEEFHDLSGSYLLTPPSYKRQREFDL